MPEKSQTHLAGDTGLHSLEMYYQPIYDLTYEVVMAHRSELRVNDPTMGVLLPSQYLGVAQRSAQAERLSLWGIETVMDDILKLSHRGIGVSWLSAYLPIRLLLREDFPARLLGLLEKAGLEARRLCLELPHEVLFETDSEVNDALRPLRAAGCPVMVSDLGNEFCPVMRLQKLKPDFILMDTYLTGLALSEEDEEKRGVFDAVYQLSQACGSALIAPGVKDAAMAARLKSTCAMVTGRLAGTTKKAARIRD